MHSSYQYELLKADLKSQDVDYLENTRLREQAIQGIPVFRIQKNKFFKGLQRFKKLFCVYCQKPLKIYLRRGNKKLPEDMATVDHFNPLGEGGYKYVISNFLCACNKCNNDRAMQPAYQVDENKFVYEIK